MKKSELYKLAQLAVLKDFTIADNDKLEVVRLLESERGIALFLEMKKEEKEGKEVL